jgi:hypothetical protein
VIVYTSPFILSEAAAGRPLTHPRIGYQTWLRDLAASAVTVSGETEEGPKDMPLRPDTATYWRPPALPATWIADLGATRDVDYVGLVGSLGSSGASVLVETSIDDGVWTVLGAEALPADDAPLLFLDASRQARKVRLTVKGVGGAVPRIASVYAGEILAMPRAIYGGHAPLTLSRVTALSNTMSRGGQFLGQEIRRHGVQGSASFRHLTAAWYRANFDPFVKAARNYPYFFGWRPETFPLESAYVWTTEDIQPQNMGLRDFLQVSVPMIGIGHA